MLESQTSNDGFRCPLCHGDVEQVAKKRRRLIWHCKSCDHYAVLPPPTADELRSIYSSDAGYGIGRDGDLAATSNRGAVHLDGIARENGVKGRLLDVGCGDGRLIYHMRELGWGVAGNDFAEGYVASARNHGLDVRLGTLQDASFDLNSFDLVNMGDVVEHLVDPSALLCEISKHLKPGGLLVVRTPDAGAGFSRLTLWLSKLLRIQWVASEAPMHINDFTEMSLCETISKAGYRVVSRISSGSRKFVYTVGASGYFDQIKAKAKRYRGWRRYLALYPSVPFILLTILWMAPVLLLGRLFDIFRGGGDYLTVVAVWEGGSDSAL